MDPFTEPDPAERGAFNRLFYRNRRPTWVGHWVSQFSCWWARLGLPPTSWVALQVAIACPAACTRTLWSCLLTQPVSREMGLGWLGAGLLVVASAVVMVAWPRNFWILGAVAFVVSQAIILSAWSDAKAGTIVNIMPR